MTDELTSKQLAEDNSMALLIQQKCRFTEILEAIEVARKDASSHISQDIYDDLIDTLTDCQSDLSTLVKWTSDAAHAFPSSRDLGEVCSKKKMGAVG